MTRSIFKSIFTFTLLFLLTSCEEELESQNTRPRREGPQSQGVDSIAQGNDYYFSCEDEVTKHIFNIKATWNELLNLWNIDFIEEDERGRVVFRKTSYRGIHNFNRPTIVIADRQEVIAVIKQEDFDQATLEMDGDRLGCVF